MFRGFVNACWFAFKWGLLAALLAAVGVGFYYYSRLNDEIRQRVQAKLAAAYPQLQVTIRSAQLIDGQGIEVRGLSISDPHLSGSIAELAYFDEMLLCCQTNLTDLLQHEPKFTRIIVRRPRIQAVRLSDGSWSVSQLLPLPKFSRNKADIVLENGLAVIFDSQRNPPSTYTIRDINLSLNPLADSAAANSQSTLQSTTGGDETVYELLGSLSADHIQRIEISGKVGKGAAGADLQGTVSGIDVSPELLAALPPDKSERLSPLTPLRGQVGFGFHIWRDPAQTQPWRFDVVGQLDSGRFEDARLPQALPDLRAKFHANNDGFQISELASQNGPTKLRCSARIDGYLPGSPITVEGEAEHLWIGPNWENILPPKLLEQWRKFQPAGEVNVNQAKAVYDGNRWQLTAAVDCLDTSFSYYRFPYRLEHGSGKINLAYDPQVQQNRLVMSLTAFAGSRPIQIEGQFLNPGPEFTGGVTLQGTDIPFDQNLYVAMGKTQPKASDVVQTLHLGGAFNFWVSNVRDDPHSPTMNQHLKVGLNRCSVRYEKFQYPLYNVTGDLEMINGQWTFRNLQGTNHIGRVTCEGSLAVFPAGVNLSLEFKGRDVVLEEELRDALPPRMQCVWNELRPKGTFDLTSAKVGYTSADKILSVTTSVEPVGDTVSIDPTFFPYRLEKVQGSITFSDGRCEFNHVRGVHDRTKIYADGFCENGAEGWHLHMDNFNASPVRLDSDRDLIVALPLRLRKAVDQLRPTGLVNINGTNGSLDFWGDSPPLLADGRPAAVPGDCRVRAQWRDLHFDIEQGTLHAGVDVKNIHGGGVFSGSYDPQRTDGPPLQSRGWLKVDSLTWNGFQFTDLSGPLWLDDRQVVLGAKADIPQPNIAPRKMEAKFYGGMLQANAQVLLEGTPRFGLEAAMDNVDLNRFCTEAVPGRQKLKGRVSGGIDLQGDGGGVRTLVGKGGLQLRDADIYRLPVMVALLNFLNLKPPDTSAFSTSDMKFHILGDNVTLDDIQFGGDVISVEGKGEMNLSTAIRLTLHTLPGRSDIQLPVLKALVGGASQQIMQIQVTGTLADPVIKREAFPTINQALQTLQSGMQPQERSQQTEGMRPYSTAGTTPPR